MANLSTDITANTVILIQLQEHFFFVINERSFICNAANYRLMINKNFDANGM